MPNGHLLTTAGRYKAALPGARHAHDHDEDGIGRWPDASRKD